MTEHKEPDNRYYKYSFYVAALSLVVSICALSMSIYMWNKDRSPSIKVTGIADVVNDSYESFIYGSKEYGRYLFKVTTRISNNSNQGCILDCLLLFKSSSNGTSTVQIPYPPELIYKDGIDPLKSLSLDPRSSCSVDVEFYIYLPPEVHQLLKETYGDELPTTSVETLLRYLYTEKITPEFSAPIMANPIDPTEYKDIPDSPDHLWMYYTTNTGASFSSRVDYLNHDYFDKINK